MFNICCISVLIVLKYSKITILLQKKIKILPFRLHHCAVLTVFNPLKPRRHLSQSIVHVANDNNALHLRLMKERGICLRL